MAFRDTSSRGANSETRDTVLCLVRFLIWAKDEAAENASDIAAAEHIKRAVDRLKQTHNISNDELFGSVGIEKP